MIDNFSFVYYYSTLSQERKAYYAISKFFINFCIKLDYENIPLYSNVPCTTSVSKGIG